MPHGFLGVSPEEYVRAAELAREVLEQARNTLLIRLRFLDSAINRLKPAVNGEMSFATDGAGLYFEPFTVLRRYREEPGAVARDVLHVLLHCLLRHLWFHGGRDRAVWDLACDVTVEVIAGSLGFSARREEAQKIELETLRRAVSREI